VPDSTPASADRERDVFVTSFDMKITFAHGRRPRVRDDVWNVFLGTELIEHFEDVNDAVYLARKVSTRTGRPAWLSPDGVTFETIK
jgi:hypothetical protein